MRLAGRDALRFCRSPSAEFRAMLLYGADAGLVEGERSALLSNLFAETAGSPEIASLDAATVRRDPSLLHAALRTRGFFGEQGAVLIEGASDSLSGAVEDALEGATSDDAVLILTAANLPPRSRLRDLFTKARTLVALQFFAEAPGASEIDAWLSDAGLRVGLETEARDLLISAAAEMDRGSFRKVIENVALYSMSETAPLSADVVTRLLPAAHDAALDDFVHAVAAGQPDRVGPLLRRLTSAGATPTTVVLGLQRHFRRLLRAASAAGGVEAGLSALQPPPRGPARQALKVQLANWQPSRLEAALRMLFEADARIRSTSAAPAEALIERYALRLAMIAGR